MTGRREQIFDAALEVASTQGLAAVSMRAVAERVGVTPMAIYRHVRNKDALLDALVGRLLAEVRLPEPDLHWRDRLVHVARELHALARRYPTVVPLLLTRVYVAPDAVRVVHAMCSLLADAGVPSAQIPRVERLLSTFLLGYTVSAANDAFWRSEEADPTAWDRELDADLDDLSALVERVTRGATRVR